MKPIYILLLCLYFQSFQQPNYDEELKIKTNKVLARLISGEPLPGCIRNLDALTFDKPDSLQHDFEFLPNRLADHVPETVTIFLNTRRDSLLHFTFTEQYFTGNRQEKAYTYSVNKYGVIDFAYSEDAPEDSVQPIPIYTGDGTVLMPVNTKPVYEIYLNSPASALRNPDKKIIERYNARLKLVIDELYDILYKE